MRTRWEYGYGYVGIIQRGRGPEVGVMVGDSPEFRKGAVGTAVGVRVVGEDVGATVVGLAVGTAVGVWVVGDVVGATVVGDGVLGYISIAPIAVSDVDDCNRCRRPSTWYCAIVQYRMFHPGCISATLGPRRVMNLSGRSLMKEDCALCAPNSPRLGMGSLRWIALNSGGRISSIRCSSSNNLINFMPLLGPK